MGKNKVQLTLTPLPKILDGIDVDGDRGPAVAVKKALPPTDIRCISFGQMEILESVLKGLDVNDGKAVFEIAGYVHKLAVKDCVNCSREDCDVRSENA